MCEGARGRAVLRGQGAEHSSCMRLEPGTQHSHKAQHHPSTHPGDLGRDGAWRPALKQCEVMPETEGVISSPK